VQRSHSAASNGRPTGRKSGTRETPTCRATPTLTLASSRISLTGKQPRQSPPAPRRPAAQSATNPQPRPLRQIAPCSSAASNVAELLGLLERAPADVNRVVLAVITPADGDDVWRSVLADGCDAAQAALARRPSARAIGSGSRGPGSCTSRWTSAWLRKQQPRASGSCVAARPVSDKNTRRRPIAPTTPLDIRASWRGACASATEHSPAPSPDRQTGTTGPPARLGPSRRRRSETPPGAGRVDQRDREPDAGYRRTWGCLGPQTGAATAPRSERSPRVGSRADDRRVVVRHNPGLRRPAS
jgi:hypothetical protein